MERKLAHVEKIIDIQSIPGADRIEVVTVLGWKCVVKKGEFNIGDKIIYVEVDSVMPELPEYEFLRERKFRVRTIKLRKQISQGLVLALPKVSNKKWRIGDNMTEYLEITKYLTPTEKVELRKIQLKSNRIEKFMMRYSWFRKIFLSKNQKYNFPYWVSKTDEERIQNMPQVLQQFADKEVYVTEKIDYQSGTWTSKEIPKYKDIRKKLLRNVKKVIFVVASRNLINNNKNSLYWKIADKYNLEEICKQYSGIIIQGEQGSTNIQGNKYELTGPKMWIFNIIHPDGSFMNYDTMKAYCRMWQLDYVPLITKCKLSELGSTVDELVKFSEGKSLINPKIQREGIVVRYVEGGKKLLSFKVVNPKFLLKYES